MTEIENATSAKKSLSEHKYFKDPVYRGGFQTLLSTYCSFRECVRDGNCMYISYAVSLADVLCVENKDDVEKMSILFEDINTGLRLHGVMELVYSGFYESFMNVLTDISSGQNVEDIQLYSWYDCVAYLRLVIADEMRHNLEKYQPYIPEVGVDKYCAEFVDPFYKEAGCVEIYALSNSIPVKINVVNLTTSMCNTDVYGNWPLEVSILYTHNHFEPVYTSI